MTADRGRAGPPIHSPLVGWVYLSRYEVTVRWKLGDLVAYVLEGNRVYERSITHVIGTVPVLPAGWTDLAQIRELGRRWIRSQHARNHHSSMRLPSPEGRDEHYE
jgi:hypothetical protein